MWTLLFIEWTILFIHLFDFFWDKKMMLNITVLSNAHSCAITHAQREGSKNKVAPKKTVIFKKFK